MHDAPAPNWRDAGSDSLESSAPRAWQASGPAPEEASGLPSKRGVKRALAAVFLVAFAVGIGVLLYMLRHNPPTGLVLVGSGYEKNLLLPHNIYGWNGLKKLEDASDRGGFFRGGWTSWFNQPNKVRLVGDPLELNKDVGWTEAWKKIAKQIDSGPQEEKTVVIAISMHGIADGNEAYLLRNVPDVQSLDAFNQSRIPFRDVLDSLKSLKNKDIVLLLDVCHMQTYWPIGMVQNDFVATLQKNYEKDIAALGNLTVICSTSPDQLSWESEELQTTLFGHFVAQGLAGAGRPNNENVTAATLFQYVADNVGNRAKVERAREQLPIMIGGEGAERTANEVSLVHVETAPAPKPAEARAFADADLTTLRTEWNKWKTLKTEQAPYVYAPHWWRLYQETLLRYEQLLRAGDPTGKASDLKKDLASLQQNILDAKGLKAAYKCVGNNFPIPRVLGFQRDNEVADEVLRGYYSGNPENRNQVLERYGPPDGSRYVLGRLSRLVWDDMLKPGADFDAATIRTRLAQIGKELQLTQRPVEVQLLKMLENADPKLDPEIIKLALRVRASSEETALSVPAKGDRGEQRSELYAEVIFQRIKDKVENADKLRRNGEDLLFGNPEHAVKARDELKKADAAYEDARADADQMRKTLALRDELAADLPFMAAWLAALPSRGDAEIDKLRRVTEELGDKLALLNRNLGEEQKVTAPDELAEIRDKFFKVADRHQEICVALKGKVQAGLQQDWHAIDAALRVPPLDVYDRTDVVELRLALLSGERGISGNLHVEKDASGIIEADKLEDRLERNEKMLIACLKPYLEADTSLVSGKLAEPARKFYFKQPAQIKAADAADDEKTLLAAVDSCRVIPAGLVDPLRNELTEKRINPAERLRRLRTYQLLQWLGQRTLEDHWFDTPDATYYGPTAAAYFDSARSLFDKDLPKALVNDEKEVKASLARAGLTIVNPPNPYWTSEVVFPLAWQIQAEPAMPEGGTPMVWLDVKPAKGDVWQPKEREKIERWPSAKKPYPAAFRLAKNPLVNDGDIVTLHAVYRGQHLTQPLTLRRPAPDLVIHHPPARATVGFAARMDSDFNYGAISIVLDNSGSMTTPFPNRKNKDDADLAKNPQRRFDYALKAMEEVLVKIPNGTELSIFSFGGEKTTKPIMIRPPSPWKNGTFDFWMDKLRTLSLKNNSPVAKTITTSMETGFLDKPERPRAIVVLTDGMDNCSYDASDARANTLTVQNKLRDYNAMYPDIDVVVVCIVDSEDADSTAEAAIAREQFEFIQNFTPKSGFFPQAKGADLGKTIEGIIRPRVELKAGKTVAPGFAGGRPVNFNSELLLNWGVPIPADHYSATILRTTKNKFDVKMPPGNDIFAVLKRSGGKLFLERGILGHQKEVLDVAGEANVKTNKDGWLASLLENRVSFGVRELSQLVTFEKVKSQEREVLQQTHPGFVWMELTDDKGKKPNRPVVWGKEWSTPAAAFRIRMPDWPKVNPKLSTWYWPDIRENFLETDKLKLKFRDENVNDQGPVQRATDLPIESVIWEPEKELDTPVGGKQIKDCIVVRFRYPQGKPIFIDLIKERDGPEVGAVHLYYSEAGKGTACFFGPARPTTVKLVLIDIEEFKKAASTVEFTPRHEYKAPAIFVRFPG